MEKKRDFDIGRGSMSSKSMKSLARTVMCTMLFVSFAFVANAFGQVRCSLNVKEASLKEVFQELGNLTDYRFVYSNNEIEAVSDVTVNMQNCELRDILSACLKGTGLGFRIEGRNVIVSPKLQLEEDEEKENVTVRGWVRDVNKNPLPGVTILLTGTSVGSTTNEEGWFSMTLPMTSGQLEFSFVGYEKQRIHFTTEIARDTLNIVLLESEEELGEVVVTGYQTMRKSDVVGSVTTIKASDVMMPAYTSIDQMLQGRVAGMMVMNTSSRVGTNPKIRVRGTSTILGNQDPLWVVDGIIQPDPIPIDQSNLMVDDLKNILGNQISWLNPADIETITVLKDASATAIYGSKAANGVIVITTKRGKGGVMTVNYSGTFSFRSRPHYGLFNLMNSAERIQFSREAFAEGAIYSQTPVATMETYEGIMRMLYEKTITSEEAQNAIYELESANTNWLKLLTRNSFSHNHNLSVSGGSDKVIYSASLGYSDQAGIEIKNDAKNLSGRLNLGVQVHPKVHVDLTLTGSINKTWGYAADVNPLEYATNTSRAVKAYNGDGTLHYIQKLGSYEYINEPHYLGYNILNEIAHSYSKNKSSQINGTLNLAWEIIPGLRYEFVGGINNNTSESESYAGEQTFYVANSYRGYDFGTEDYGSEKYNAAALPFGGELYNGANDLLSWNIQNKVTYTKSFDEMHRLNVLLGTEVVSSRTSNKSQTIYGYVKERGEQLVQPTPLSELVPIGNVAITGWGIVLNKLYNGQGWTRTTMLSNQFSVFATLAYSLKDRYVLNASMRNDASNRFGQDQNKRFDPTYSFGLSWNVALEPWMRGVSNVVNQLNLRASYGIQGNTVNSISPELILTMGSIKQGYGEYQSKISRLPNPKLSWERTKSWNFGLDLQLLQWISMNLEYYTKSSNNIVNQPIALEYGRDGMEINGGKITNSGVEYTLNVTPVRTKDWGFTIGFNSSKNWNKAKTQSITEITLRDYLNGSTEKVLKEGTALSSFWSFNFRGLNHNNGLPEFNLLFEENEHGEYVVNEESGRYALRSVGDLTDLLVYSGTSEPDFTGGLTTRLRWKGLTFGANFSMLLGGKKRLPDLYPSDGGIPLSDVNLSKDLLNRWKKPGDELVTDIPGVYAGRTENGNNISLQDGTTFTWYEMWQMSDARVVDASFFRCQQMSLTWNVDESWCAKFGMKSLSLNAIVNNVFVIADKKFDGFDPELGDSVQPKIYSFGVTIGF